MRKTISICAIAGLAWTAVSPVGAQDEEKVDFEKQVWPMLKESCTKCHLPPYEDERGRTRRPKGGIIFTNKADILAAVDEDEELILVPGKPDESRILEVMKLPLDDEYHFPPEDKAPEPSDEQKADFEKWIAQGADFGTWERDEELDKKMEE